MEKLGLRAQITISTGFTEGSISRELAALDQRKRSGGMLGSVSSMMQRIAFFSRAGR